jgi:hypothetical protein
MSKKVVFSGIEILSPGDDQSSKRLLGFVESMITRLEASLDGTDENFSISIHATFSATKATKYNISIEGITNRKTRDKVVRILQKSTETKNEKVAGVLKVDLQVQDN